MQVYIRADGNFETGSGHLIRTIALAHMLNDDFIVSFVCKEIPEKIKNEIEEIGFTLIEINDEKIFFELINPANLVVLDGYNFNTEYQKIIKSKGAKLICIDDLHDREFFADLIINHSPKVSHDDYVAQPYTHFALGHEYALLRPAFLKHARQLKLKVEQMKTVLICFGGSDSNNFTEKTLRVVLEFKKFTKIIVVTGPSYKYAESLQQLVLTYKNVVHCHAINEGAMLDRMLEADVAIVPASGMLYEALSVGCKVISGYYVKNQIDIYEGFLRLGAIVDAKDFTSEYLIDALNKIQKSSIVHIIDGCSPKRLVEKIKNI